MVRQSRDSSLCIGEGFSAAAHSDFSLTTVEEFLTNSIVYPTTVDSKSITVHKNTSLL